MADQPSKSPLLINPVSLAPTWMHSFSEQVMLCLLPLSILMCVCFSLRSSSPNPVHGLSPLGNFIFLVHILPSSPASLSLILGLVLLPRALVVAREACSTLMHMLLFLPASNLSPTVGFLSPLCLPSSQQGADAAVFWPPDAKS